MTAPAPLPETLLSFCARQSLSKDLALDPSELSYIGMMAGFGYLLALFNIEAEGALQHSTRSVRIPYDG